MQFSSDPLTNPGDWDVLIAAGQQHPGLFRLGAGGGARNYKWDVKDAPAMQGAFMTYRGWRPTLDIKGTFVFWEPGQVQEFLTGYAQLWYLDARKLAVKPVTVYHPALASNDITLLVPVSIGDLQGNSQTGWSINFTWHEYRAAKVIIPRTPEGATTRLGKAVPQTETQKEIMRLRAEDPF